MTAVAPEKLLPAIVTLCPSPLKIVAGVRDEMTGALPELTAKSVALVAVVCPATSTVILPVVAPVGTVAVIDVAEEAVIVAVVPLNLTVGEEKFDPLIVTLVPTAPELGLKPLIVGPVPPLPEVKVPMGILNALPTAGFTPLVPNESRASLCPVGNVQSARLKVGEGAVFDFR